MSFLKMDVQTKQCLWITAGSLLLWRIGIFFRATSLINIYVIKKILDIFPNFILCIAIPFGLLTIIHFFKLVKNETRLFYYIIFIILAIVILGGYSFEKKFGIHFDIYSIIASFMALFIDMVIQNYFEIKIIKKRDITNG